MQVDQNDATSTSAPPADPPAPAFTESVRVRDSEIEAALYDTTTGEYFQRPPSARHNRTAADDWVAQTLAGQKTDKHSQADQRRAVGRPGAATATLRRLHKFNPIKDKPHDQSKGTCNQSKSTGD